jgi:hypothetical protein
LWFFPTRGFERRRSVGHTIAAAAGVKQTSNSVRWCCCDLIDCPQGAVVDRASTPDLSAAGLEMVEQLMLAQAQAGRLSCAAVYIAPFS